MVVIRMARGGAKKRPFYAIVVADQRRSPRGRYIERLGFYNPRAKESEETLRLDRERLEYWVSQGAKMTDTVAGLYKKQAA
jgi:small subunit ribosomal protein S16